jgi:hypothetical protein
MTKLCPRGKAAAKRKFKVYPSAYANAYASKICAGKIKDPSGVKRKDFKGRKPAAEGGSMVMGPKRREQVLERRKEKLTNLKGPEKIIKGGPRKGRPVSRKPLPIRGSLRVEKMGGGLMEATQRLKRQGLRKGGGADRMKSIGEKEFETYNKVRNEMDKKRFLERRKEQMRQDKKRIEEKKYGVAVKGGGMISKPRAMYRKGGGVCLRGMNRDAIGKNS